MPRRLRPGFHHCGASRRRGKLSPEALPRSALALRPAQPAAKAARTLSSQNLSPVVLATGSSHSGAGWGQEWGGRVLAESCPFSSLPGPPASAGDGGGDDSQPRLELVLQ